MQASSETAERVLPAISDPLGRAFEAVRRSASLKPDMIGAAVINCIASADSHAERGARVLAFYLAIHPDDASNSDVLRREKGNRWQCCTTNSGERVTIISPCMATRTNIREPQEQEKVGEDGNKERSGRSIGT